MYIINHVTNGNSQTYNSPFLYQDFEKLE